jgi:PPOX class probable F420-dependent enzyme
MDSRPEDLLAGPPADLLAGPPADLPAARIDCLLRTETVVWLSTVSSDGLPYLVPVWFSWDGEAILIASKPTAKKVRNVRANPRVMLALGEPDDDFDVGMVEGAAELVDGPAAAVLPRDPPCPIPEPNDGDRAVGRRVPRDLLAGHPHPPDPIPALAWADGARKRHPHDPPRHPADGRDPAGLLPFGEWPGHAGARARLTLGDRRVTVSGGASCRQGSRGQRSGPVGR